MMVPSFFCDYVIEVEPVNEYLLLVTNVSDQVVIAKDLHEDDRVCFTVNVNDVLDTPPDGLGAYKAVQWYIVFVFVEGNALKWKEKIKAHAVI